MGTGAAYLSSLAATNWPGFFAGVGGAAANAAHGEGAMGGKAKRRVGAVADWAMADEPDWEAIRRDYQATMASAHEIARRHGVTAQGIANKARVFGWVRLADMARIIQRASASLTRRGRTLMARAETPRP
jgi:hypothetical protein